MCFHVGDYQRLCEDSWDTTLTEGIGGGGLMMLMFFLPSVLDSLTLTDINHKRHFISFYSPCLLFNTEEICRLMKVFPSHMEPVEAVQSHSAVCTMIEVDVIKLPLSGIVLVISLGNRRNFSYIVKELYQNYGFV